MYIAGFRFQLEYAKSERSQRRNPNDAGGLFLKYDIRGQIGSGSFARVHRAVCKKTGEWSAVKIIDKKRFKHNAKTMFMLQREVSIMQALDNVGLASTVGDQTDTRTDPQICTLCSLILSSSTKALKMMIRYGS